MITRGAALSAQRTTTQASERIVFSTGLPPLAREKCLQSGDAQSRPTGRPRVTSRGSTFQTSSVKCRVSGWLARCISIAAASWLMATSGPRPSARLMPSEAPPPPAKESTISSR
jgi:hypothetical protein